MLALLFEALILAVAHKKFKVYVSFWVIGFGLPLVLSRFFDVKRRVVACCHKNKPSPSET